MRVAEFQVVNMISCKPFSSFKSSRISAEFEFTKVLKLWYVQYCQDKIFTARKTFFLGLIFQLFLSVNTSWSYKLVAQL